MESLTLSQKKYLFAIYKLGQDGQIVRSADVAKIVGVSKPSTVKMTQRLIEDGYILKEPYTKIKLTEKGIKAANELYTPSIIIANFFKNEVELSDDELYGSTIALISQLSKDGIEKFVQYALKKNKKES